MKTVSGFMLLMLLLMASGETTAQPDSLWSRTYGTAANDSLWGMVRIGDGNLMMSGYTREPGVPHTYFALAGSDGRQQMASDVHAQGDWSEGRDVINSADGAVMIPGICKIPQNDARRATLLKMVIGGQGWFSVLDDATEYSEAFSVINGPEGSFFVGGTYYPGNEHHDDFALWKIDANGRVVWRRNYGEAASGEYGISLLMSRDGRRLVLAGQRMLWGEGGMEESEMMLVISDLEGRNADIRRFTLDNRFFFAMKVIETADRGFLLAGAVSVQDEQEPGRIVSWDGWLVKTNAEGQMEWNRVIDNDRTEWLMDVKTLPGGGFVVVGAIGDGPGWNLENTDCIVVRTDAEGEMLWQTTYGGTGHDTGMRIIADNEGGYYIGGSTSSIGAGGTDFWLLKLGRDPVAVQKDQQSLPPQTPRLLSLYPNPFNREAVIRFDRPLLGGEFVEIAAPDARIVGRYRLLPGVTDFRWRADGLPNGAYRVILRDRTLVIDNRGLIFLK